VTGPYVSRRSGKSNPVALVAAKPTENRPQTTTNPCSCCQGSHYTARVRSSDHGHWTIGIDEPTKIKCVLISSTVIISSAPVHQSRCITSVRKNIISCNMVLLPTVKRKAVKVGGGNTVVLRGRVGTARECDTNGFVRHCVDSRSLQGRYVANDSRVG